MKKNLAIKFIVLVFAFCLNNIAVALEGDGQYDYDEPIGTVSVSTNKISRVDAINLMAIQFDLQPKLHTAVTGEVSLNLSEATLSEAMGEILPHESGYSYMVENGNLHIFKSKEKVAPAQNTPKQAVNAQPVEQKPKEPVVSKIIQLNKRNAYEIQNLIKEIDPNVKSVFDSLTNSLILHGLKSNVERVEKICSELETSKTTQRHRNESNNIFVTKVFVLEHADFESVEKELENVIERETSNGNSSSSNSSTSKSVDKNGVPIDNEYFLIDKSRRTVVIHTIEPKMQVIEAYFNAINNPLPQVIIEAQIVSVKESLNKTLGINWNVFGSYLAPDTAWNTNSNPANPFTYGKWDLTMSNARFEAAQANGDIKILSRPRILAVSGTSASIHVGEELPYVTSQTVTDGGATTQNVEYKQVGVQLDVLPTINKESKTIVLKLVPEVSEELDPIIINGNRVPVITTRKTESTVEVRDGETMVIGGLLKDEENVLVSGVPVLRNLPGFAGKLFRSKTTRKEKTNLMILLTPRIITDEFRDTVSYKATMAYNQKSSEIIKKISRPLVDITGKIKVVNSDPDIYNATALRSTISDNFAETETKTEAETKTENENEMFEHTTTIAKPQNAEPDNEQTEQPKVKRRGISSESKSTIEKLRKKVQRMKNEQ